jgi:hypothetical protein
MQSAVQYDQAIVRANDDIEQSDVVDVAYFDTEYTDNPEADAQASDNAAEQDGTAVGEDGTATEQQRPTTATVSKILAARRAARAAEGTDNPEDMKERMRKQVNDAAAAAAQGGGDAAAAQAQTQTSAQSNNLPFDLPS